MWWARLRTTVFYLIMFPYTGLHATLGMLLTPLVPYRFRYKIFSSWSHVMIFLIRVLCGIRHVVHGLENIPKKATIVLSKHQSSWETFFLPILFPQQTWVIKKELLKIPFFGWSLGCLRPIAIDRKAGQTAREQVIEQGTKHLQEGRWVVIFPEGTRIPYGQKGKYGMGGANLAAASGFPILPIAHNAGKFWPRGSFLRPGIVKMIIGPLIESQHKDAQGVHQRMEHWIEETQTKL